MRAATSCSKCFLSGEARKEFLEKVHWTTTERTADNLTAE